MIFFNKKKEPKYVSMTPEEKQDLFARCDAKIEEVLKRERINAVIKAQEEFKKVIPILNEINLNKLNEALINKEITEQEFTEYSDKLLDLQNKLR